MKGKSVSKLVKKLDEVYSKFIRCKYSENGNIRCYTCGAVKPYKDIQCGHFLSRRHYSIRWDENNTRPQCKSCNIFNQGRQFDFGQNLIKEIGNEAVENLQIKKNNTFKLDPFILETLIKDYSNKLC